jgi:DNA polymerase III epsilon subunit-like protein
MRAPDTYTVVDTETAGFKRPYVLQVGFCEVSDGLVDEVYSLNITPPEDVSIDKGALEVHGLSREHLVKTGAAADEFLPDLREAMLTFKDRWMMGQNFTFDTKALNYTFETAGLEPIDFDEYKFIDVGVVFKAHKLAYDYGWGNRARRGRETLNRFFRTIKNARIKGLKWNIDHCMKQLEVDAPERGNHDAGEDCRLTHLIYKAMLDKGIVEDILF